MTTRMQQRRGTSTQWTNADPVLAAGEIGFETDSGQFKIGDGVNNWSDLSYFQNLEDLGSSLEEYVPLTQKGSANGVATLDADGQIPASQLSKVIDGAPAALDTLKELAAAIDNNASFASSIISSLSSKISMTELNTHSNNTLNVHGITNTANLATTAATGTAISNAVAAEEQARTLAVSNAIDTAAATATTKANLAETNAKTYAASYADGVGTAASTALSTHNSATTGVHGISNTANLATKTYADTAVSTHAAVTTSVHGIADTAALATKAYADSAVSTHEADTTSVHGIADTSALALTATVNSGLALKANLASPTFTGTVSGITSTMVGLGNVDNTSDANKPVSTATTTALALKAPLASPALTGVPTAPTATAGTSTTQVATTAFVGTAVSNLVNSAPAALDTLNELATALGNDASFSTTITNSIALKAPLASPTFTGTVTAPAITATALITASASGVAFTDGTQTKEGVISRTPIVQKTASYTLSALTERDSLVEISSASGVTLTVPTNATVAYPVGTSIDILQTGAGQITVAAASGVTVNATPGMKLRTQWSGATLFKRATDTWVLYGDLSA